MDTYIFKNESIITRSENDSVVVTTHRIRYHEGKSHLISIMLDNINSIRVRYESKPVYIVISALLLIGAGYTLNETNGIYPVSMFVGAIVFGILFLSSRKHVITISSCSTSINFHTEGMKRDAVLDFVNTVENARNDFLKILG